VPITAYSTRFFHARHLLTDETARTVACSIVGLRLDYCNAVVFGAPTISVLRRWRWTSSSAYRTTSPGQ